MRFHSPCFVFLIILSFVIASSIKGQTNNELRQWADNIASVYAEEMESEDLTLLIEDLYAMARNPIDLNTAQREDLERIFFLSDIQVENILYKRYVNGPFYSIYELQTVEGLPVSTIKLLQPVVCFGEKEEEKPPFRVWGDVFLRSAYQLEAAKGFKENSEGATAFKGDRFKLYNRAEVLTNRGLSAGFIAEKDPGEPMFNHHIKGLDLMTGYVHYENNSHWIREAVIGQYRSSAGQGLVLQSGMPMRKSSMTTNIRNRRSSFRPSLSASEASGMHGGFVTIGQGNFEFTTFSSYRSKDGRLRSDSCLTSLREDGLHRTETELEQRKNINEKVNGGKITFMGRTLTLEAGHLFYRLSRPLCPVNYPYNQYYFRGKEVNNSWLSYMLGVKKLLLFGEVSLGESRRPALWNGLVWGAAPGFSLALSHRAIPVDYKAPLAGPMTESGSFSGEQGFYVGFNWQLPHGFTLSSYFDRYRFNWLKFRVDAPSSGFDWLGEVDKKFDREASLVFRYRHREKPGNLDIEQPERIIDNVVYDQIKVQYRHKISPGWQFTTLGQWHFVKTATKKEYGNMLAQDIKWKSAGEKLTLTGRYAVFASTDYLARLYAYEPHVLYMFSVPAYTGEGTRSLFLVNYKIQRNLHAWMRVARWHYSDREETGSGHNLVNSDKKTDFTVQLRLKF